MTKRLYSYLLFTLFVSACASQGLPQDEYESVGFVQEKLGPALTAIESAYRVGTIDQAQKNGLLDRWQKVKDAESSVISVMANGGEASLENMSQLLRALVRELVLLGLLEDEA